MQHLRAAYNMALPDGRRVKRGDILSADKIGYDWRTSSYAWRPVPAPTVVPPITKTSGQGTDPAAVEGTKKRRPGRPRKKEGEACPRRSSTSKKR